MKAEFRIEGMHCGSCALDIKETLEELAGVGEADVTFDGKSAVVQFDERVIQPTALVNKIQELGYTATIAEQPKGA
jgi:copper chaperone CopZ